MSETDLKLRIEVIGAQKDVLAAQNAWGSRFRSARTRAEDVATAEHLTKIGRPDLAKHAFTNHVSTK